MTLFYIPFLHPRRSKDLLGLAVSHLNIRINVFKGALVLSSWFYWEIRNSYRPQHLSGIWRIVNRIDAEQEYYFLNPNWWHYVASFFDYGILKLAILNHFDMFGLTRLVGLSSEMQLYAPCMLCKKDEVLSAKLSVGVFRRLIWPAQTSEACSNAVGRTVACQPSERELTRFAEVL